MDNIQIWILVTGGIITIIVGLATYYEDTINAWVKGVNKVIEETTVQDIQEHLSKSATPERYFIPDKEHRELWLDFHPHRIVEIEVVLGVNYIILKNPLDRDLAIVDSRSKAVVKISRFEGSDLWYVDMGKITKLPKST